MQRKFTRERSHGELYAASSIEFSSSEALFILVQIRTFSLCVFNITWDQSRWPSLGALHHRHSSLRSSITLHFIAFRFNVMKSQFWHLCDWSRLSSLSITNGILNSSRNTRMDTGHSLSTSNAFLDPVVIPDETRDIVIQVSWRTGDETEMLSMLENLISSIIYDYSSFHFIIEMLNEKASL